MIPSTTNRMNVASGGIIVSPGKGSTTSRITFRNGSSNEAVVRFAASNASVKPNALVVKNDAGDVFIHAAGNRGMRLSAISGNAVFNGTLTVESALDMESTDTLDRTVAALHLKGGMKVQGNLCVDRGLVLDSAAGYFVKLRASDSVAENYTMLLPENLPSADGSVMVCDTSGKLSWKAPSVVGDSDDTGAITPVSPATPTIGDVPRLNLLQDVSTDVDFSDESAGFLVIGRNTYKNTMDISSMSSDVPEWSAVSLLQPSLDMEGTVDVGDDGLSEKPYFASTLTIEDAPQSKYTKNLYALSVKKGNCVFRETHDSTSVDDAAVVIKGGLSVGKVIRTASVLYADSVCIDNGSILKRTVIGKSVIGASAQQFMTVQVTFDTPMRDADYVITGNVVSAQDNDSVFATTFKHLTPDGFKVTVYKLNGSNWDDITTAIHYMATVTLSSDER